jgi:MioC protein
MDQLRIFVGTVSGNAEMCAEDMGDAVKATGREATLESMADLDADAFGQGGEFLIVCSTHGVGDVPDEALDFFEELQERRPDLGGVRYGVFSLGDSVYDTFCYAGKQFDELLSSLGATRVGSVGQHDASSGDLAEDVGVEWIKDWIDLIDPR